jgi:hypothetical protein
MTHDELINKINVLGHTSSWAALRAVIDLHEPDEENDCLECWSDDGYIQYPCPTILTITKELQ